MSGITTALFDFDGVIADTEPMYDIFWEKIARKYHIGIPDFPAKIKGTTLQRIFDTYFSTYSPEETGKIARASAAYELQMDFPEIKGAVAFLHLLKTKEFRLGLVTSSSSAKMKIALKKMNIDSLFDTLVTADRISRGKPDPMCYLLAAADVQSSPEQCVVFEDSFSGIQAGTAAGMKVIGLATTNSAQSIRDKVASVIPDFSDPEHILNFLSNLLE